MTPATYAEQTRVEIYEPELETDETLQPQAVALAQGIGSQLVPISFEVIGADKDQPMHNQYAYAAHVLFDATMNPDFVSIADIPKPDAGGYSSCLDTAAECGDKSKIVPVINLVNVPTLGAQLPLMTELIRYHNWGIEKVLVDPQGGDLPAWGPMTAKFISLVREYGQFSSVGVIVNSEKTSVSRAYDRMAQELAGADFGITQLLLNPKPYVELVQAMRNRKVKTPILPGIKPFRHDGDAHAAAYSSSVQAGEELSSYMKPFTHSQRPNALMQYFIGMGADLIKRHNAPGLHIYTDNNVRAAQRLATGVGQAVHPL